MIRRLMVFRCCSGQKRKISPQRRRGHREKTRRIMNLMSLCAFGPRTQPLISRRFSALSASLRWSFFPDLSSNGFSSILTLLLCCSVAFLCSFTLSLWHFGTFMHRPDRETIGIRCQARRDREEADHRIKRTALEERCYGTERSCRLPVTRPPVPEWPRSGCIEGRSLAL